MLTVAQRKAEGYALTARNATWHLFVSAKAKRHGGTTEPVGADDVLGGVTGDAIWLLPIFGSLVKKE
jgi:hypothetical protein